MSPTDWQYAYTEPKTAVAVSETVVLSLFGVLLGYFLTPDAPYFAARGFSWVLLGPALSGLRYGLPYALGSVLILAVIAGMGVINHSAWAQGSPMGVAMLVLFAAVVAGEFRNYWYRRLKRLHAAATYLHERVEEVGHAFNMLKYSHDRLEQILASKITLRDSISTVRRQILLAPEQELTHQLGVLILNTVAELGSLQGLSLHAVQAKTQRVSVEPIAYLGQPQPLDTQHPLVLNAISSGQTTSLKLTALTQADADLLVVIPLIDVYQHIFGIIAVNKMPFRAYRQENLQLLAIMGGYLGDLLYTKTKKTRSISNEEQLGFYLQAMRCMEDVQQHDLHACLMGFELTKAAYAQRLIQIITQQRGLDQVLLLQNRLNHPVVLLIMPLTDLPSVEGYLMKLHGKFKTKFGFAQLQKLGLEYGFQMLAADKPLETSMQLLADELHMDNIF